MYDDKNSMAASSTVFLSLILLLVASLLFTLLEGARISGLKSNARMDSELVTESLLAAYCTPLVERYRLFLLDGSYGNGTLDATAIQNEATDLMNENLAESGLLAGHSYDLYHMQAVSCELKDYQLVTDGNGEAFYQLITDYMKNNLSIEAAELVYQKMQEAEEAKDTAGNLDEKREDALDSIQQAKEEKVQKEDAGKASKVAVNAVGQMQPAENPIEYVADWKNTGILSLIGADEQAMSELAIDRANCLENREKASGTMELSGSGEWYERILFQEYLMKYFGCYTEAKEDSALQYELEYLIAGGSTDKENLAEVATRLLAIREAANFIFIQADKGKVAEALTLATLLIGYSCNPILVRAVQEGILAAWAFAESVSDVKSLLNGERIPILKTSFQWSTEGKNLSRNQKFDSSKKCENGLGYRDYLRILLYLGSKNTQSLRAMDLMEQNLHLMAGYENIRMDAMLDKILVDYSYQANPLFLSFVTVGNIVQNPYQWTVSTQNTYLQQK